MLLDQSFLIIVLLFTVSFDTRMIVVLCIYIFYSDNYTDFQRYTNRVHYFRLVRLRCTKLHIQAFIHLKDVFILSAFLLNFAFLTNFLFYDKNGLDFTRSSSVLLFFPLLPQKILHEPSPPSLQLCTPLCSFAPSLSLF